MDILNMSKRQQPHHHNKNIISRPRMQRKKCLYTLQIKGNLKLIVKTKQEIQRQGIPDLGLRKECAWVKILLRDHNRPLSKLATVEKIVTK